MIPAGHFSKTIMVDKQRNDFTKEKDPLRCPAETEPMHQHRRCGRRKQSDGEPYAYTGHATCYHCEQKEKFCMAFNVLDNLRVIFRIPFALCQYEKETAANSEMRNENVKNCHAGDHKTARKRWEPPDWIFHTMLPRCYALQV